MRQAETTEKTFRQLQRDLVAGLQDQEPKASFIEDAWQRAGGGGGLSCVIQDGEVLEKAGVNFSAVHGDELPSAASARRPHLAGQPFRALGVSVVVHPRNPYAPTSHANVRYFEVGPAEEPADWWFGGGFDLTPYYGFAGDCKAWHQAAKDACEPLRAGLYDELKRACDEYFYLPHRQEHRGIGGLFYDDFTEGGFEAAFAFTQRVGAAYAAAYLPILAKRKATPCTGHERAFQLYRRGRYVEFNLLYDRGTLFGLQSGGRTESILMSLPPLVRWEYTPHRGPDNVESRLVEDFLQPRDWLASEEARA